MVLASSGRLRGVHACQSSPWIHGFAHQIVGGERKSGRGGLKTCRQEGGQSVAKGTLQRERSRVSAFQTC